MHATGQNDTGPPITSVALVSPFVDNDLGSHRQPSRRVLTGLQVQPPGLRRSSPNPVCHRGECPSQ
jgi:hypothetical protein